MQVNGAANTRTTGIVYASEILRRFGEAYGALVQQFPVPAFFDDPATKEALFRERSIRRVLDLHERMDVVVFGVGAPQAPVPSHVYSGGYLDPADRDELTSAGVVGDVSTVFYRADGSWRDIGLNARAGGPDLDTIKRAPRRICVVAGRGKAASLRGRAGGRARHRPDPGREHRAGDPAELRVGVRRACCRVVVRRRFSTMVLSSGNQADGDDARAPLPVPDGRHPP